MKTQQLFYIKERRNPQLGTYFVAEGQMSKRAAKRHENSIYGLNIMHGFNCKKDYQDELIRLIKSGKDVQDVPKSVKDLI